MLNNNKKKPVSIPLLALLTLSTLLSSTTVQAADVMFYKNGGCDDNKSDYAFCTIEQEGECCQAFDPFCGELACRNCDGDQLSPFWGSGNCTGYNLGSCTVNLAEGINCCMELGSNATCSGHIGPPSKLLAEADKRDIPCTNPQHPDGFSYIDLSNVRREITNMTKEVHDQVMGHYRNGDYIILNKMATAASV